MHNEIKLFAMDVDGTLTDGKVYISADGEMFKVFNIRDGYAISSILKRKGIKSAIITGRNSEIVTVRAAELGIDFVCQGVKNKLDCLNELTKKMDICLYETAFIGDDLPDLECIKVCGNSGCPADSVEEIKRNVAYVCKADGGCGAVREYAEYLFSNRDGE